MFLIDNCLYGSDFGNYFNWLLLFYLANPNYFSYNESSTVGFTNNYTNNLYTELEQYRKMIEYTNSFEFVNTTTTVSNLKIQGETYEK